MDAPATIDNCDSQDLLNTESNVNGTAIVKRKGYSLSASLPVSTSPVTGSHSFIDGNGNSQTIVCQDRNCSKSTNGNAFSLFLTTAAVGITRWSFVDIGGILYGGNNRYDPILRWDGTTVTNPAGMPAGSILETTQSRLAIGDITGQPNRVHYSSSGAYEQFTIGINEEDSWFDDIGTSGDKVRGMKYFNGNLYIFKTNSLTVCEISDQYNTECAVRLPNIGTTDPASIITAGDSLYFRGQDKNYWEISGNGVSQISRKIQNLVKSQTGGTSGGESSNTQTSKTDWELGTQAPLLSWNTATTPGSIFASSVTLLDTLTSDFTAGTLSNISISDAGNAISLSSSVFQDSFSDGNYTSSQTWTIQDIDWEISSGRLRFFNNGSGSAGRISATQTISTGSFKVSMMAGSGGMDVKFISLGTNFETSGGYALRVVQNSATTANLILQKYPGATSLATYNNNPMIEGVVYPYTIYRTNAGVFTVYVATAGVDNLILTATDTTYSTSTHIVLRAQTEGVLFDDFYFFTYPSTGQITSRIFDTNFSTSIGGTISVSSTTPSGTTLSYQIRGGNSPTVDATWSAFAAVTNGSRDSLTQRYRQYQSSFTTTISTISPSIQSVSIIEATTGQFYTQCIQPNSSISSWGTLSCSETKTGGGSLVYYATSAASCATLPTTEPNTWQTSTSNNATLTISTNAAVRYGFRSLLGSATDQAQVDACTIVWNDGTIVQPSWAVYDSIKNALYWTTTTSGTSSSNRLLKYDRNLESWYPFSIAAQAPRIINNILYFGSSSVGSWYSYGSVDNDLGAAINGYWITKDIGADNPFLEKNFSRVSLLTRNQGSGTMTVTSTLSNGKTGNYSVNLATTTGLNYSRSNYLLPLSSPQNFINLKFSNSNANEPFEVLGVGVDYTASPWKVTNP